MQGQERWNLLPYLSNARLSEKVESFIQAVVDWRSEKAYIDERIRSLTPLKDSTTVHKVRMACQKAVGHKLADYTTASLSERIRKVRSMANRLEQAGAFFRDICGALTEEPIPFTLGSAISLTRCLQALDKSPWEELPLRHPCLETEQAFHTIQKASEQAKSIIALRMTLEARFDLKAPATPTELHRHAYALRESGLWGRMFGREYREAKRAFRRLSIQKQRCGRHEMARSLQHLAESHEDLHRFHERKDYPEVLGPHFEGINTSWDRILRLVDWYRVVQEALPNIQIGAASFRQSLLRQRLEELKALHEIVAKRAGDQANFDAVIGELSGQAGIQPPQDLSSFAGQVKEWLSAASSILEALGPLQLRGRRSYPRSLNASSPIRPAAVEANGS